MSDKIDFKPKLTRRDREGYYIFTKEKLHQEDISILNICAPNKGAFKFIKETLLQPKSHTDPPCTNIGRFLIPINRSNRQKVSRNTGTNRHYKPVDLINFYRTFHSNTKEYTFFSAPHGTVSKIYRISDTKQVSADTRKLK